MKGGAREAGVEKPGRKSREVLRQHAVDGVTVTGRVVQALLGLWWHVNGGLVGVGKEAIVKRRGEGRIGRIRWEICGRDL